MATQVGKSIFNHAPDGAQRKVSMNKNDKIKVLVNRGAIPAAAAEDLAGAPESLLDQMVSHSKPKTLEDAVARIPEEFRGVVEAGLDLLKTNADKEKELAGALIAQIKTNARNTMSDEDLGEMSPKVLQSYAKSLGLEISFAGSQPPKNNAATPEVIAPAPTIESFLK